MTTVEKFKKAAAKAQEVLATFSADEKPDVLAARMEELSALPQEELIKLIINLEKPKNDRGFRVEDVAKALLEEEECALFNYGQIAALIQQVIPEAKTSAKSVASYASKRKEEWEIVAREKIKLTMEDLLNAQN